MRLQTSVNLNERFGMERLLNLYVRLCSALLELKFKEKMKAIFEKFLLCSKFLTLLPVLFCIAAGAAIFVMASYEICSALYKIVEFFLAPQSKGALYVDILSEIITAIDLYLVAIVLLIFVFGIYELFIDEFVDLNLQVLKIASLDELKHKLGSVIIMVLVVDFFKRILHTDFTTPLDMLLLAGAIFAVCLALYILSKFKG